jgi:hypothetical protein
MKIFHSALEVQPWFQLEFVEAMHVTVIIFTNRMDSKGERFKNIAIHVGDQPAVIGALIANPECAFFVGPSATGNIEHIMCTEPLTGRYVQLQMRDPSEQYLQIDEIEVYNMHGNYTAPKKNFPKKQKASHHETKSIFKSHPLI